MPDVTADGGATTPEGPADARLRRIGVLCSLVVIGAAVAAPSLAAGTRGRVGVPETAPESYSDAVLPAMFVVTGMLLIWTRPWNRLGWLFIATAACDGFNRFFGAFGTRALAMPEAHLPGGVAAVWVASWVWLPGALLLPSLLLLLYPTGRLPSRRWRPVALAALIGTALVCLGAAMGHDSFSNFTTTVRNPLAAPHWVEISLLASGGVLVVVAVLASVGGALWRLWRSESPERQQLALLFFAIGFALSSVFLSPWEWVFKVALAAIPVATVVGVLRYRLLGIEVVIRRTLIYGALSALIVLVFAGVTAAVSTVVSRGPVPLLAAAVVVAVGLTPVRDLVQRSVDRLLYGDRRDPVAALTRVGDRVGGTAADELLPAVLEAVATAMRAPGASVLDNTGGIVAAAGTQDPGRDAAALPLRYAGVELGRLVVTGRGDGAYGAQERTLLATLAPQVAVVVQAVELAADLASAKDRVLTSALNERLRLRQDLHDGLGPALSGMALGLQTAEAIVEQDPAGTRALLTRLRQDMDGSVAEVRRLVDGLRPPALDELGLVTALRAYADAVTLRSAGRVRVIVEPSGRIPDLPAEVEVAAYRIATEGVTNTLRHADAASCTVTLEVEQDVLTMNIDDDGHGLPAHPRDGVGLGSMRSRAEALGGTFTITSNGAGTHLAARLPATTT